MLSGQAKEVDAAKAMAYNPFSKQIFETTGNLEAKQPAGVLPAKVTAQPASDTRLLVVANSTASFYQMQPTKEGVSLVQDPSLPCYSLARIARFAPRHGKQAAIVSNIGLHFVDLTNKKESLLLIQLDIVALEYSPCDRYVICCEKFSIQSPAENLFVICTQTGRTLAKFEWKKLPKDSIKSIRFTSDDRYCLRLIPSITAKEVNSIEVYKDGQFGTPFQVIPAKFATKAAQNAKKGMPPTFIDGRFDGFDLCCLNPNTDPEKSPLYMFAWQHAAEMSTEDDCGTVYAYDLHGQSMNKSKFMITCPKGQDIATKFSSSGYAVLVWSQSFTDSTGKSYYGEHSLQYVQIFGGRDRQFVPVFDNMIQDVAWVPSGETFIVISGVQPATATLYDKDCNPLFEFGKRYRNTIRICPFSQIAMIGGFGNLTGEIDFWNLQSLTQLGKTKSYCSVGIEWAPDGVHLMTSVLYERVKVDNLLNLFSPTGKRLSGKGEMFEQLHWVQWQPNSNLQKPSVAKFAQEAEEEAVKNPKRVFAFGGSNSSFSQIMRQEMGKASDQGPRKLDQNSKQQYKEMGTTQAAESKEKTAQILQQASKAKEQPEESKSNVPKTDWRKGNFLEAQQEQKAEQQQKQQQINDAPYGGNISSIEVKPASKHAKRRANKKARQVDEEPQQEQ